jgi:hypothetical protein
MLPHTVELPYNWSEDKKKRFYQLTESTNLITNFVTEDMYQDYLRRISGLKVGNKAFAKARETFVWAMNI